MERIIKGDELMVFEDNRTLAYATAHTLTISGNSIDVSSKDHGFWGASEVGNITWEVTSENLYTDRYYSELFDAMVNKTQLSLAFGFAKDYDVNGFTGTNRIGWDLDTGNNYYSGKAYVTSLTANANSGENATYSVTFSGWGSLVKKGETSTTTTDEPSAPDYGELGGGDGGSN